MNDSIRPAMLCRTAGGMDSANSLEAAAPLQETQMQRLRIHDNTLTRGNEMRSPMIKKVVLVPSASWLLTNLRSI